MYEVCIFLYVTLEQLNIKRDSLNIRITKGTEMRHSLATTRVVGPRSMMKT